MGELSFIFFDDVLEIGFGVIALDEELLVFISEVVVLGGWEDCLGKVNSLHFGLLFE